MQRENVKLVLLLLWLTFLIRALFYVSIIPLWEGFDEHAHFAYVQHIAEHVDLPLHGRDFISKEVFSSLRAVPLPWEPKGFGLGFTHDEYWRLRESDRLKLRNQVKQIAFEWRKEPITEGHGYSHINLYEAQQGPLYYMLSAIPYRLFYSRDIVDRVFAIRLFSILIASLLVPLSFFIAKSVFTSETIALAITALIIFMPGLMADVCRVGNDCLAIALFSGLLALCIRDANLNYKRSIIIGIILGAGLLTKSYFFTAIPAIFIVLFYSAFKTRCGVRKFLSHLVLTFLGAGVISLWWYLRNYRMLRSFTGIQQNVALKDLSIPETIKYIPKVEWRKAFDGAFVSHIWFGNWSFLTIRSWMYHLFFYLFLISLLGILLKAVLLILKRQPLCAQFKQVLLLSNFYLWFVFGLSYYVLIIYISSHVSATGGWYLYCVVIPEIILLVYGLYNLVPGTWRTRVLGFLIILFSLLDLYGVSFILIPYYTGFISHKPNGSLISFKPHNLSAHDFGEMLIRLTTNKPPFMTAGYYVIVGIVFLSISLVAISVSARLLQQASKAKETGQV
jgi:hypothetical protein